MNIVYFNIVYDKLTFFKMKNIFTYDLSFKEI